MRPGSRRGVLAGRRGGPGAGGRGNARRECGCDRRALQPLRALHPRPLERGPGKRRGTDRVRPVLFCPGPRRAKQGLGPAPEPDPGGLDAHRERGRFVARAGRARGVSRGRQSEARVAPTLSDGGLQPVAPGRQGRARVVSAGRAAARLPSPHRIELDYVAAPRRPQWIGVSVLILALAVSGDMVLRYRNAQHELAAVDAAQGLLNANRRPQRAVSKERLDEEAKIIDAAVRQLSIPWAQMIEAIEAASSNEVTVLQLQPETQQRSLRLTAEAQTPEAMLRYRRPLGRAPLLSPMHPFHHPVPVQPPSLPTP